MENKMMMPACYSVMTEDEMTYTSGGDAGTAYAVGWVIGTTISIANMVWGIGKSREWIQKNKKGKSVTELAAIWRQILFRNLPTFQRLASYLVISGKADPCTVFPEMQIAFIVDKVDRFFYLLHQHPPSNSSENLLRPSASQDSSTVAL